MSPDKEKQIIEDYIAGKTSTDIAKKFEIHPNTVLKILKKNSIKTRYKWGPKDHNKIIELYQSGMSATNIANQYDHALKTIIGILKKNNIKMRSVAESHRKYKIREDFFDNIDCEEKAYILGFAYADGCNQSSHLNFQLNVKDIDILKKISGIIFLENQDERISTLNREKLHNGETKIFTHCSLSVNSNHICQQLTKLGCTPKKSLTAQFPNWLIDKELQRHFIRGYYDGDGGCYLSKNICNAKIVGTKNMIETINEIVTNEFNFHIYNEYKEKYVRSCISGKKNVKTFLDWIYDGATIYLDRKYNLYKSACNNGLLAN